MRALNARIILTGLTALLLLTVLAYLLRDLVRTYLLIPTLYVLWAVRVIYYFIPGSVYWLILLIILINLANRSLSRRLLRPPRVPLLDRENRNPIETWAHLIQNRSQGDYYRWKLANQFASLALQLIAHREQITPEEVRDRLLDGTLPVPEDLRTWLITGLERPELQEAPGLVDRLLQNGSRSQPELPVVRMVEFLENYREAP